MIWTEGKKEKSVYTPFITVSLLQYHLTHSLTLSLSYTNLIKPAIESHVPLPITSRIRSTNLGLQQFKPHTAQLKKPAINWNPNSTTKPAIELNPNSTSKPKLAYIQHLSFKPSKLSMARWAFANPPTPLTAYTSTDSPPPLIG